MQWKVFKRKLADKAPEFEEPKRESEDLNG